MRAGTFSILVGIDFSDSSVAAMYHAVMLAERIGATLHLCHIAVPNANLAVSTDLGMNLPPEFAEAKQARERLERLRSMIKGKVGVEVHLRIGDPERCLMEAAAELRADMVVVGSHGKGAVVRLLLGSVSTKLTHRCPVPVLVVPAPGREAVTTPEPEPVAPPPLPSLGNGPDETLDLSRTNDASGGSVNVTPCGMGNYDVNPELRIRY
jgi:nucleotide-binding universal stress UspA family protein